MIAWLALSLSALGWLVAALLVLALRRAIRNPELVGKALQKTLSRQGAPGARIGP